MEYSIETPQPKHLKQCTVKVKHFLICLLVESLFSDFSVEFIGQVLLACRCTRFYKRIRGVMLQGSVDFPCSKCTTHYVHIKENTLGRTDHDEISWF